ncbi:MAG: dTDP-4-dehydrorhamnose reductase [Firmicutes bacterium]|nr:dTDP-4-dehydrorhamnose reductase [Bacillota bacterium]
MKRILITGGGGMLACALAESFNDGQVLSLPRAEMDITDLQQTWSIVRDYKPHVILNPAAFTRVDDCEIFAERAFAVNARGAENIAVCARRAGARLVHFSTDYIFDGQSSVSYREDDRPNPLSVYGASKLAGEVLVRKALPRHYIVRTSWLFGKSGANFVSFVRQKLTEQKYVQAAIDQIGSPTFTDDLARAVKLLIETDCYGTYHLTNSGFCSRYQLALEIAGLADCCQDLVIPIKMEQLKLPANRPRFTVLDNASWRIRGFKPVRHYKKALRDFFKDVL